MAEKRDNIEIRLHDDGTLDEIVIYDPHNDKCLFHLEQMDDHYYWMRAYGITQDLVAHIGATIGTVDGMPVTDEKGFIQAYEQVEGPKVYADFEWDNAIIESEKRTIVSEDKLQITEIVNKYGIACVLHNIADVLRLGRCAEHEKAVIKDLEDTCIKFLAGDKAFWDAAFVDKYKNGT